MNILVRVQARAAQSQIAALEKQIQALQRSSRGGMGAVGGLTGALRPNALESFGSRLQWIGRQLQYNFTLPIAAAGIAATKFELDNEKAMTGVTKVYGDGSVAFNRLTKTEIPALGRAFEVLSNEFAVNRAQVIGIAADWAQAGASGIALAKSVKLTLETMILGEMNATEATQALIAIQAQYGQSVEQLSSTIDVLNMVENQTGITMEGLVQGFARAAGVARSAGVDVRHLAAFLAALTPAAGSAANAGNALKTIFSRLMAPTKDASDVMGQMGINVKSLTWQSMNGTQRLEEMAKKFHDLSGAQKLVVSSTIASRFQINRFDVLMRDIINTNGYYQKALNSTADATANYRQRQYELNTVLNSNPQRLKQIWTILQNALADTIQPMLPAIMYLAGEVAKLATWFSNLNPAVQHLVTILLLLLAAVGPVVRYLGAFTTMLGAFKTMAELGGTALGFMVTRFLGLVSIPFGALATGLGAVGGAVGRMGLFFVSFSRTALTSVLTLATGGFGMLMTSVRALGSFWMGSFAAIRGFTVFWATQMRLLFSLVGLGVYTIPKAIGLAFASTGSLLRNLLGVFAGLGGSIVRVLVGGLAGARVFFSRAFLNIFLALGRFGPVIIEVITGPIGWAIGAAVALFAIFHRQLGQIWHSIIGIFQGGAFQPVANLFKSLVDFIERQFDRLPSAVQSAFVSVVRVVESAAMQVYRLFSYLNPFAHHSPSLVENTHKGMQHVRTQHARTADSAQQLYSQTAGHIQDFNKATGYLNTESRQFADKRAVVKKVDPAALASFDKLIADLVKLDALMAKQKAAVDAQQVVVDKWKAALDAANAALDVQQKKLESLQKTADALNTSLQQHQDALQNYAQTPITGMKAMGDAIFANDQAQKKLQLQLLQMEDVVGPIDKVQAKMANLAGDIEKLKGEQTSLRAAGAGSDITGAYDQQINQLQAQQAQITQTLAPMTDLQNQLDKLQRQGEELNLQQSLQFDPLTKQIQDMTNSMKEMPFDQIVAGIQKEQDAIAQLQPQADAANKAVADQQAVVDAYTAARDKIQASYDVENAKLQKLQDEYQKTADMVNQVKDALNSMSDAAQRALDAKKGPKLGTAAQNFQDAAGGNFPDVGGMAKIGREGGLADQSAAIDAWARDEAKNIGKTFGSFDMFKPIRDKWNDLKAWFSTNVSPALKPIGDAFGQMGGVVTKAFGGTDFTAALKPFKGLFDWISRQVRLLWQLFGPDVKRAMNSLIGGFEYAWKKLGPEIKPLLSLFQQIWEGVKRIWTIVKPIIEMFAIFWIARIKMITDIISRLIGPAFHLLVDTIKNALDLVIGIVRLFVDLFTGQWSHLGTALKEIVTAIFKEVWDIFSNAFKAIGAIVSGFVDSIIGFFKWLWDELVGHSIIPDMIKDIIKAFTNMPGDILKALAQLGTDLANLARDAMQALWNALQGKWGDTLHWLGKIPGDVGSYLVDLGTNLGRIGRDAMSDLWTAAKNVWSDVSGWFGGLPGTIAGFFSSLPKKMANVFSGAFDGLVSAMKSALNWVIDLWNSMHFSIGGWGIDKGPIHIHVPTITVGLPHIPHVGGSAVKPGSAGSITVGGLDNKTPPGGPSNARFATGGIVRQAQLFMAGEGSKVWPEYIIPTDPQHRRRALGLVAHLARTLGPDSLLRALDANTLKGVPAFASGGVVGTATARAMRSGGTLGPVTVNNRTEIHFHGDLEFPNIKSGDDAEEFLRNLEAVI